MAGENDRANRIKAKRYDLGKHVSDVAILAGFAGALLGAKEYFSGGSGDMVPVSGLFMMGSLYGKYYCERMGHLLRTGEDLWAGRPSRAQAYKNFFGGDKDSE